jgi:uncharacterized protein (DUF1330 family)
MTAYWVNTVRELKDADKLARYAELATPAIAAHGGRFIARGLPEAAFEEGTLDRTAIIEFPSVEAAVAAYESEALSGRARRPRWWCRARHPHHPRRLSPVRRRGTPQTAKRRPPGLGGARLWCDRRVQSSPPGTTSGRSGALP